MGMTTHVQNKPRYVAFRVDASIAIGAGHVMRCLTLADALSQHGCELEFFCRPHPGNLGALIASRGYAVHWLGDAELDYGGNRTGLAHSDWLGVPQEVDATDTLRAMGANHFDWLVVDHYALDAIWETALRLRAKKIMVIDDLADRAHECDVLLDQNLGRKASDYSQWVGSNCELLIGPDYALLRPEFKALRSRSITRRKVARLTSVLVSMGGVDKENVTEAVLRTLAVFGNSLIHHVMVVMGASAPHLERVKTFAETMTIPTEVKVNVRDMAFQMSEFDLAIGAAGGTAWERCCLGMASVIVVLADNQRGGAFALQECGAAYLIEDRHAIDVMLPQAISVLSDPEHMMVMQDAAARITDGNGVNKILDVMRRRDV